MREGDAERLRDYATATQRAQPAGFAAQRPRSHRPPAGSSARAHLPAGLRPRKVGSPPAQARWPFRPAYGATAASAWAGARLPAKALGLSGACRGRGRPAAEKPSRPPPGPAPRPARPRHVQGSRPREEAARALWGRGEKAERKEVPPGTLSREGGRAASTLAWARTGTCEVSGRFGAALASRLGLDWKWRRVPACSGQGRLAPLPLRTLGIAGDETATGAEGRQAPPEARAWAWETLRGELRPRGA